MRFCVLGVRLHQKGTAGAASPPVHGVTMEIEISNSHARDFLSLIITFHSGLDVV